MLAATKMAGLPTRCGICAKTIFRDNDKYRLKKDGVSTVLGKMLNTTIETLLREYTISSSITCRQCRDLVFRFNKTSEQLTALRTELISKFNSCQPSSHAATLRPLSKRTLSSPAATGVSPLTKRPLSQVSPLSLRGTDKDLARRSGVLPVAQRLRPTAARSLFPQQLPCLLPKPATAAQSEAPTLVALPLQQQEITVPVFHEIEDDPEASIQVLLLYTV